MMRAQLAAFDHGKLDALPVIPPPGALWRSLKFWIWTAFAIVLLAAIPDMIVDYWFFASVGKTGMFWTNFNAQLALFVITLIGSPRRLPAHSAYAVSPTLRNAAIHLGSWSGLFAGWVVSQHWMTLLLWQPPATVRPDGSGVWLRYRFLRVHVAGAARALGCWPRRASTWRSRFLGR